MAIPAYETLMLPVLRRVAATGEAHIREVADAMADEFALTSEERTKLLPSGRGVTVIRSRAGWARSYLVQAGLLASVRRGVVRITERGQAVLREGTERIDDKFLMRFPEFRDFAKRSRKDDTGGDAIAAPAAQQNGVESLPTTDATPTEQIEAAERELKAALAADLLERVRAFSPSSFEQLIVDLLVRMGYGGSHREAAARLGRAGDGGIDGVIREDALGLDTVYIQAKRYAEDNAVGAPAVQGFAGALLGNGATKGVFVTTSRFTAQTRIVATAYKSHRIILIDGDEAARLVIEHEVGVRTMQTIRLQRLDLDAYEDEDVA